MSILGASYKEFNGDMRTLHGELEGNTIDGRGGKWVTILAKLLCLKILSDNLRNFQIVFVGGQNL
jgi:hypothetical protein